MQDAVLISDEMYIGHRTIRANPRIAALHLTDAPSQHNFMFPVADAIIRRDSSAGPMDRESYIEYQVNTGLIHKVVPRFGDFCYCSCLLLLPGFACSIHATWVPDEFIKKIKSLRAFDARCNFKWAILITSLNPCQRLRVKIKCTHD